MTDIFGAVIDPARIEDAAQATLQAWLPAHLAHQERENDLPARWIPQPRSWPTISEFDPEPQDQLPSIVIVSPGTTGEPHRNGQGRIDATWRLEVAAVVGAKDERATRKLASMYVAAIRSALVQNPTLGGLASATYWLDDDYAYGTNARGRPRAIYAAIFAVTVKTVVDRSKGPVAPPDDPYDPPAAPETFTDADITVNSEILP